MTDSLVSYSDGITVAEAVIVQGIEQLPVDDRAVLDALADGDAPVTISEVGRVLGNLGAAHCPGGARRAYGKVTILDT